MAGSTKMIIITSDEDVIRQFALNNNKNTHIVNLDNNKQVISTTEDTNNIINLDFLAHLSAFNSNNDHVYKRALESTDHVQPRPVKSSRKSIDMICTICGDRAIGYNYNALSCGSCKAFFRRNANQSSEKFRCLLGTGECSVAHGIPRKCAKCRLKRCFEMGMRKDFIQSEEEKQRRRRRLQENRNISSQSLLTSESVNLSITSNSEPLSSVFNEIDQLLMDVDKDDINNVLHEYNDSNEIEITLLETLSVEDWIVTEKVRSAFLSIFENHITKCSLGNVTDRTSAIISWSEVTSQLALRFISFFRQIDEFENLHADDRFILIKYNLFSLFPIYKCFNYSPMNHWFLREDSDKAEKNRRCSLFCNVSNVLRQSFITLITSFVEIIEQDAILLSLLLVILLFSQGLSMNENEPSLKDPLAVARTQFYYTQILWNYMISKRGETKTCKQFTQLLTGIFRIQSGDKIIREYLRVQLTITNTLDLIGPLIQTVLNIS